jgi:hypothetical protein
MILTSMQCAIAQTLGEQRRPPPDQRHYVVSDKHVRTDGHLRFEQGLFRAQQSRWLH